MSNSTNEERIIRTAQLTTSDTDASEAAARIELRAGQRLPYERTPITIDARLEYEGAGWHGTIFLSEGETTVSMSWLYGEGTAKSERLWYGCEVTLLSLDADIADLSPVIATLESIHAQCLLWRLRQGRTIARSERYDCEVGSLSDDASEALGELQATLDAACHQCPRYGSVDGWFSECGVAQAYLEEHGGVDAASEAAVIEAMGEGLYLDITQVRETIILLTEGDGNE